MYAASVGKKQIGKGIIIALVGLAVLLAVLLLGGKDKESAGEGIDGSTEETRRAYLSSLGLVLSETSSIADVGVPEQFDERFTEYNEMLKTTGFDLESYKGKTIKKCSYNVVNREDLGGEISAVLLLDGNTVIGGHLVNLKSGTLYPLFEASAEEEAEQTPEEATETILPAEETATEPTEELNEEEAEDETEKEEIPASAFPTE